MARKRLSCSQTAEFGYGRPFAVTKHGLSKIAQGLTTSGARSPGRNFEDPDFVRMIVCGSDRSTMIWPSRDGHQASGRRIQNPLRREWRNGLVEAVMGHRRSKRRFDLLPNFRNGASGESFKSQFGHPTLLLIDTASLARGSGVCARGVSKLTLSKGTSRVMSMSECD